MGPLGLVLGLTCWVVMTPCAPWCATLARELGVVGGLGWHLGKKPGSRGRIVFVDDSGFGSRVY